MNQSGNVIACVWDFDKTLIPGYMQAPLFREYGIDEVAFWEGVESLPVKFRERGIRLSEVLTYLTYLLELVKIGCLPGLSKKKLTRYGAQLTFFPGIPDLFSVLKEDVEGDERCRVHGVTLEHYIVSSGHLEVIRGSQVAPFVDGIFACEFLEDEMETEAKEFFERIEKKRLMAEKNGEFSEEESDTIGIYENADQIAFEAIEQAGIEESEREIRQIARVIDNTQKTRCLFEINKGSNKNSAIDVNATIDDCDRRVPFRNMIYIADGPSDIPAFSVIRRNGGKAFAVYEPNKEKEFAQNDRMLEEGRIDAYGPADYRLDSSTAKWIRMHVKKIAQRILDEREQLTDKLIGKPPEHLF
ncbi:MAG: haloacid dehalogenase-like hydrolase [Puniceicoccales bacterium]|jgi:hypothetical protein|nr:haloacid dehalogenase-like hydrolase [Puniceicoccales bacterium]